MRPPRLKSARRMPLGGGKCQQLTQMIWTLAQLPVPFSVMTSNVRLSRAKLLFSSLLLVALAAAPAQAAKGDKNKLAVLDLEAKGVDKSTTETLTEIVTVSLKQLGVFDVISRSDIQQMLNFEESKQLVGCTSNSSCIAEIGGALGVARVVSGSVGKLGSSYVISLSLLDTKSSRVLERESRTVTGSMDQLVEAARAAAKYLVRGLLEGKQGDLLVKVSELNSEIEVDGKLVGVSPMPRMKMASGPHKVVVSKTGFVSFARDVVVDEKEPLVLDATLIPSMDFISNYDSKANAMRIAAYVTAGVGVGMITAALVTWFAYNDPRNTKHNAEKKAIDDAGGPDQATFDRINRQADGIRSTYVVAQIVGIAGAVAVATGVVLFVVGPKPGIYDEYKTVTVGDAKVTMDVTPLPNGGYAAATVTF